jgi:hypothetical protein
MNQNILVIISVILFILYFLKCKVDNFSETRRDDRYVNPPTDPTTNYQIYNYGFNKRESLQKQLTKCNHKYYNPYN